MVDIFDTINLIFFKLQLKNKNNDIHKLIKNLNFKFIPTINASTNSILDFTLWDDKGFGINGFHHQWELKQYNFTHTIEYSGTIDIREISALNASKTRLEDFQTLELMAEKQSPELLRDVSTAAIERLMLHREIREDDIIKKFKDLKRVALCNSGGSHHLSAAKNIASKINQSVNVVRKIREISLQKETINDICRKYKLVLTNKEGAGALASLYLNNEFKSLTEYNDYSDY